MDKINYRAGCGKLRGSMADASETALSTGFDDVTKKQTDPWDPHHQREDDDGTNYVGDRYARRHIGACGRPDGNER